MTTKLKLGYMDTCYDKTMKHFTPEALEALTTSASVCETMKSIEAEADAEKKCALKEKLPVVLFACEMPEDGKRVTSRTGKPSGLCMHDWDHLDVDVRKFYADNIAGKESSLGIVFAHVTPRGEGLRLVTTMHEGEKISKCQHRLANDFGMLKFADGKIKDISRLSFLPSKDYILYVDEKGLFERELPTAGRENAAEVSGNATEEFMPAIDDEEGPKMSVELNAGKIVAENSTYEGLKFSTIIEALLKRIATQGKPHTGERNDDLFILARELRHICNYNFQSMYMMVSPYFEGLPDKEIRRTISNAIATTGRTITPVMRGVLSELKNESVEANSEAEVVTLAKLPKLSEVEEMIMDHFPKHLRAQVYLASLPIWGVYGTHLRFDFKDGRENSLSFMTAVVGKSGSGKAFAAHLFELMTKRIREEDAMERRKADEYLARCNKASSADEKPEDPRPKVRIYGDDISTSQFLDYLDNLKGEHGIQFTEEVARLQKAKRTVYGDNDDLYCKAFDNSIGGKESKSNLTRNIRIPIFLNTLFCGTPGAMHKFYNNPEGGLNNRILFAFMPNVRMKGFFSYQRFTEEEQAQFDKAANRLWEAGRDGVKVSLDWLDKTIVMLKNKWDKEDDENPDVVWYDLGKRALIVAMRAGVLEWYLRDCPTDVKTLREISKVVKWVADTMRQSVYAFCGKAYEDINEMDNILEQKQTRTTKNKKLFSLLADEFTAQDVMTIRAEHGESTNIKMVLSRWMMEGKVQKTKEGTYKKVTELVA